MRWLAVCSAFSSSCLTRPSISPLCTRWVTLLTSVFKRCPVGLSVNLSVSSFKVFPSSESPLAISCCRRLRSGWSAARSVSQVFPARRTELSDSLQVVDFQPSVCSLS
jgi:hypothetical protein